ncbi:MAG: hypothetical protein GTO18_18425 [Anaerolineales bacterium]|nr:hypothetical protein [Anaerolineales bacterium]
MPFAASMQADVANRGSSETIEKPTLRTTKPPFEGRFDTATPEPTLVTVESEIYGYSVLGRPLLVYRIGAGHEARLIVGGIHGGYEWNTTVFIEKLIEHLEDSPSLIPSMITLYLIPCANPDGLEAGTDRSQGRTNANSVDLNRNWDYQWQPTASHGPWLISGGEAPFSEPETVALRDFILSHNVRAVVMYHSAMAEVYSGAGTETSRTVELAQLFTSITGYRYAPEGIPGQITTGNAIDWMTLNRITAIEVDLASHETIDWEQNLTAIIAFLSWELGE